MTFGSLFAGIGGIDLGLERAGMRCAWQVEIDDYARRVLAKHWPNVRRWDDVRTFPPEPIEEWRCDLIAGGFPCQDISNAGRRAGIDGERSGLWSEFARIIRVVQPRYVLVENVDALANRGLGRVLGDLAALGFDAEWDRIPAAAVGAPHLRWRIFIVAYAARREQGWGQLPKWEAQRGDSNLGRHGAQGATADTIGEGIWVQRHGETFGEESETCREVRQQRIWADSGSAGKSDWSTFSDSACRWAGQRWGEQFEAYCQETRDLYWPHAEPPVCGVADGVPSRLDRLRGLGNAVVPQIAEWIGRRILAWENENQ